MTCEKRFDVILCHNIQNTKLIALVLELEFKQINWLRINERCVCTSVFKFFNNNCPSYMEEMFSSKTVQDNNTRNTCNFTQKLSQPLEKLIKDILLRPLYLEQH